MSKEKDWVRLNVNVVMTAEALQTIVANAKKRADADAHGRYHLDTAQSVSEMVTRFLSEKDFESYVKNADR